MAELGKTWLGETMLTLLECARQALEDDGDRAPGLVHLVPGNDPAWDNCCEDGGQLYVRVISQVPAFPPNVANTSNCGPSFLETTLGLGVLRCTPTQNSRGKAPTAEALTSSSLEMVRDSFVLQKVIQCCLKDANGILKAPSPTTWNPLGAEGGCAGGEWQLTLGLPSCGSC